MQIESIARGMGILRGQLIFCVALAAIGSFAFQTGRFADFPYGWYDAKEQQLPLNSSRTTIATVPAQGSASSIAT